MNQKIRIEIAVGLIAAIAILLGMYFWNGSSQISTSVPSANVDATRPVQKMCTQEAKLCDDGSYVSRTGPDCEFAACPEIVGLPGKIIVTSPKINDAVSSPISISGKAVGDWFFEAVFPIEVRDSNDKLLGSGQGKFMPKSSTGTWMTSEFVDFSGEIEFSHPTTESGYIIFKKDNPSGKTELNESFKLPIKFKGDLSMADWKTYRNEKYGFEFKYPATCLTNSDKNRMIEGVGLSVDINGTTNDCNLDVAYYDDLDAVSASVDVPRKSVYDFAKDLSNVQKTTFQGDDMLIGTFENKTISLKERVVYIFHNGHIFNISYITESHNKIFKPDTSEKIFTTFKFTK